VRCGRRRETGGRRRKREEERRKEEGKRKELSKWTFLRGLVDGASLGQPIRQHL
jgi:hypothetical protein